MQPLPDPVALMAHLSCANLIFRRWSVHMYNANIRTDDEIESTCYTSSGLEYIAPMPFDIVKEVRDTLKNEGFYPSVKVSGEMLPVPAVRKEVAEESEAECNQGDGNNEDMDECMDEEMTTAESLSAEIV
mmetsp:Transcript_16202/g.34204  ORF Transcript_16202/g.34204 Transcript_16202/m.34204 type:complete len:130 (+) Transcript_16202:2645-3034(+)